MMLDDENGWQPTPANFTAKQWNEVLPFFQKVPEYRKHSYRSLGASRGIDMITEHYPSLSQGQVVVAIFVPSVALCCLECRESNVYAQANLPSGGYVCYPCRTGAGGWKYR